MSNPLVIADYCFDTLGGEKLGVSWPNEDECPAIEPKLVQATLFPPSWQADVRQGMADWMAALGKARTFDSLAKEFLLLKNRVAHLEEERSMTVPIQSLAAEPFELVKPISVVVRKQGDQYIATFFDANLSASGDNDVEAVSNLKDIIVGAMEILEQHELSQLGPEPRHQLEVLSGFLKRGS